MKNNNEFGNKKKKVYGFSNDIKQKRLGNNKFHYTVNDVNHVRVTDKTKLSKTYDTDAYFMCFYPIEKKPQTFFRYPIEEKKEDLVRIDDEQKSQISNITCFTTNADGIIMQQPYIIPDDDNKGVFGYILEEFTTSGVFRGNSNSNSWKTLPGERISDAAEKTNDNDKKDFGMRLNNSTLKQKKGAHFDQNSYNLTINDDPVFKLIEKTMRYYKSYTHKDKNKIDLDLIRKKVTYNKDIPGSEDEDWIGLFKKNEDNDDIHMGHNDINLIEKSKVSNLIIMYDYRLNDEKMEEIISNVRKLGKNYIYLFDKDYKIKKIGLDMFVALNYLNNLASYYYNPDMKDKLATFIKDFVSRGNVTEEKTEKLKLLTAFKNISICDHVFFYRQTLFFDFIMNEMPNQVKEQLKKVDEEYYKKNNKKMSSEERKQKENDCIKKSLKGFYKTMFKEYENSLNSDDNFYETHKKWCSDVEENLDGHAGKFAEDFIKTKEEEKKEITKVYEIRKELQEEAKKKDKEKKDIEKVKKCLKKLFSKPSPNIYTRRLCQNSQSFLSKFVSGEKGL